MGSVRKSIFAGIKISSLIILCFLLTVLQYAYGAESKCIEGDCKNGRGTYTWVSGDKYTGEYKNGNRTGQGTYTWANGNKYTGEFRDNKLNGQGTFTSAKGDVFAGEWQAGKMNGRGTMSAANGNKYAGEFKDGKFNGQGTFTETNGNKYVGGWKDGEKNGQGTYTAVNGNKYVGAWKDGKPGGQGSYTSADGHRYVGEYKDGIANGQGTSTTAFGDKYAGEFRGGKYNGQGTYTSVDGDKYKGEWKDGVRNGQGTYTWLNGVVYEGNFIDGHPQPPYELLFPDGTRHSAAIKVRTKIRGIIDSSQAMRIGLKKGDIVTEYNREAVLNAAMLVHLTTQAKPDENVTMVVERQDKDLNFKLKGGRIGIHIADHYEYALKDSAHKNVAASPASAERPKETDAAANRISKPGVTSKAAFGKYYALVIGNNNYASLPKLKTARNDAQTVSNVLKRNYGFNVTLLLDAGRSDILIALSGLREKLSDRDNLLIYYAGHGFLDKEGDEGYWLPVDATKNNEVNWISNSSITTQLKAIEARHIIVIADSCYSGKLGRDVHIQKRTPDYYTRIVQKRSRSVIASGGLEPVIDSGGRGNHSVFASAFIAALEDNKGIIDTSELFNSIRRPVVLNADQVPEHADIRKAGHEGGEFIFVRDK